MVLCVCGARERECVVRERERESESVLGVCGEREKREGVCVFVWRREERERE